MPTRWCTCFGPSTGGTKVTNESVPELPLLRRRSQAVAVRVRRAGCVATTLRGRAAAELVTRLELDPSLTPTLVSVGAPIPGADATPERLTSK